MKKVIKGEKLFEKMKEAVHLMCDTVKITLGPKGRNVIIDHSLFQPFITNDGVTIAENIESEDEVLQTILTLTKESSINTNTQVGDGTTTTLVLLKSIFDQGLEQIKSGINPLTIKKELEISLNQTLEKIKRKSRKPTKEELQKIATISANDKQIGSQISTAFNKVKSKMGIELLEQEKREDEIIYKKGYTITTLSASPYFLKESEEKMKEGYLLLIQDSLDETDRIYKIINQIILEQKALVIIAEEYDEKVVEEILNIKVETKNQIFLLKNPEYGNKSIEILKDLQIISNANIVKKNETIDIKHLGIINNISIDKDNVTFTFEKNTNLKERKKEIIKQLKKSQNDLDISWYEKRRNMLQSGLIEIRIGGQTKTERRERKMRFEDALWSIDTASKGIIPGSGIILLEISEKMCEKRIGDQILKETLKKPFFQILENAGLDVKSIYDHIKEKDYSILYNINKETYESIQDTEVLDSTIVIEEALKNAVSIASMLLTTNHLIVNEYKNEIQKSNGFDEL